MTDRYIADLTFYFSSEDHGPSRSFSSRSFTDQRLAILDAIGMAACSECVDPGGQMPRDAKRVRIVVTRGQGSTFLRISDLEYNAETRGADGFPVVARRQS